MAIISYGKAGDVTTVLTLRTVAIAAVAVVPTGAARPSAARVVARVGVGLRFLEVWFLNAPAPALLPGV